MSHGTTQPRKDESNRLRALDPDTLFKASRDPDTLFKASRDPDGLFDHELRLNPNARALGGTTTRFAVAYEMIKQYTMFSSVSVFSALSVDS